MQPVKSITESIKSIKGLPLIIGGLLLGIILIVGGTLGSQAKAKQESGVQKNADSIQIAEQYGEKTEGRITALISQINGIGAVSVMVTMDSTTESVYAQNRTSTDGSRQYVIIDNEGDTPVLVKEVMPRIAGVAVVCQNITSEKKLEIIQLLSALLNLPSNRIYVSG